MWARLMLLHWLPCALKGAGGVLEGPCGELCSAGVL